MRYETRDACLATAYGREVKLQNSMLKSACVTGSRPLVQKGFRNRQAAVVGIKCMKVLKLTVRFRIFVECRACRVCASTYERDVKPSHHRNHFSRIEEFEFDISDFSTA